MSGIRVVKAFAQEERQLRRFNHAVKRVFDQSMVSTRLRAFFSPLLEFLPSCGLAAVTLVGGRQAVNGTITVGEFVAFYGYVVMLVSPMRSLGMALGMAQRATASGARVFEILDREPELTSPPGAPPLPEGGGRVELRDVTFGYDEGEPVLRDVNLDVEAGSTVAVVGGTGSGKTTLVTLVSRLYDVDEGAVLVDGADVREVDLASLRSQIALVSDDAFLFSASLRENIAYARPDASDEEVAEAARRAGARRVRRELAGGLRHADRRARAVALGRPAPARGDRPGARRGAADPHPRRRHLERRRHHGGHIKQAMREVMRGRTTFVIAHRLSTIALADEIVVLEEGRIVARGSHEELLEQSELYREIAERGLPDQVFLTRKPQEPEVAGL